MAKSYILQLLELLAGAGPEGYTNPIRQNLGMDTQWGGKMRTSGMTSGVPTGYTPTPVKPDPVVPTVKQVPLKFPKTTPTTTTTTTTPTTTTTLPPIFNWLLNGGRNAR